MRWIVIAILMFGVTSCGEEDAIHIKKTSVTGKDIADAFGWIK